MTYNIRYDNPGDGINSWDNRKEFVSLLMRFHGADIVCIQEGLVQQVRYLHNALEGFDFCGVGRDDGKEAGEFSAIYFRKEMFDLLADSTFWLSLTPARPSKGWDAALPRIVTWAHFKARGPAAPSLSSTRISTTWERSPAGRAPGFFFRRFHVLQGVSLRS